MNNFQKHIPSLGNYEKGLPNFIFKVYKNMDLNRDDVVIPMNVFKDQDKATRILKNFMDRGAKYLSYFNRDYSKYIIYKNEHSEEFIKSKTKAKEEAEIQQVQQQEN